MDEAQGPREPRAEAEGTPPREPGPPTTLAPTQAASPQAALQPAHAGRAALDPSLLGGLAGSTWGDLRIGDLIGSGGMGAVYRGRQLSLDRPVAVKVLARHLSEHDSFRQRFLREARAVAQITSPNVVQIHAAGEHDGHQYFVMELVEGVDLARRLAQGWRPGNGEAFDLVLQAARGLAAAGQLGIVHRDVKPANMLLTADGTMKLSDFGLAKLVSEAGAQGDGLTAAGIIVGTAGYFSPEQGTGERCDQRTDIYALGVVAYELLTGRLPFSAADTTSIIYQHVHEAPRPPSRFNPTIHPRLEALILRCLAKKPEARYQTAAELVAALEALALSGAITRPRAGNLRWTAAAILALAALAGAAVVSIGRAPSAPPAAAPTTAAPFPVPPAAEPEASRAQIAALMQAAGEAEIAVADADAPASGATSWTPSATAAAATAPAIVVGSAFAPAPPSLTEPSAADKPAEYYGVPASMPVMADPGTAPDAPPVARTDAPPDESAPTPTTPEPDIAPPADATIADEPRIDVAPEPVRQAESEEATEVIIARPMPRAADAPGPAMDAHGRYADVVVLGQSLRFRWILPGPFLMGSPVGERGRDADEEPHPVRIARGYWIADSECTQALWSAVTGYDPAAHQELELPVEQVSWTEVQDFIARLGRIAPGLRARLPTEPEWEYAARAGSDVAAPDPLAAHAWWSGSAQRTPHPPRRLAANKWGLYDMLGNVAEWCHDSYGPYATDVDLNPDSRTGGAPVIRGGSFKDGAASCRFAERERNRPQWRSERVGFRLAADSLPGVSNP